MGRWGKLKPAGLPTDADLRTKYYRDLQKQGLLTLTPAQKAYRARFGKAGIDYRTLRIMRTETAVELADREVEFAKDTSVSTGLVDWVLYKGRDGWGCDCAKMAAGSPYDVNDPLFIPPPLHPNCDCVLRPRLKTDDEIINAYKAQEAQLQGGQSSPLPPPPVQVDEGAPPPPQATPPDKEEQLLNMRKGQPISDAEKFTVKKPNPNYVKGRGGPFGYNCQRVVPAGEWEDRDFDVEAVGYDMRGPRYNEITTASQAFKNPKIIGMNAGGYGTLTSRELLNRLMQEPDGARFAIHVDWNKRSAHVFTAKKINGTVSFMDYQTGDRDVSNYLSVGKTFYYFRMDNLEFNDKIDFTKVVKARTI